MLSMLCRQLFINTCTFLMMVVAVLQVFAPYSRTVLTFVLKIVTLALVDNCFKFQMFFGCKYAALAFPIRTFKSASDPPCSSVLLPSFFILRSFSVKCDSIVVCCVVSENLAFPFVYVETYCF
ncbi:unnamed protein product [Schistosoma curassoni]|uniref:Secreted protein n=1 Tax=Schistosoma curassoni TaxID=6186 RepID=A0A183K5S9_9TREM|nr:unnamed protein product [Schistosoma curassoni]